MSNAVKVGAAVTLALLEFHFGHCIGHYVTRLRNQYQIVERENVEMVVDKDGGEYIYAGMSNVLAYVSNQDPSKLEKTLKIENGTGKYRR